MGQYWIVVNLDKRESLGWWGKLGEWLFQAPNTLTFALGLADPAKLPACDSLIRAVEPGALFESNLISLRHKALRFPARVEQSSHLFQIPNELVEKIFSYTKDVVQVTYFGMTCQHLWEIARHELYRRIAIAAAARSWAGDRVICIGDYLAAGDLPENLLTSDEDKELHRHGSLPKYHKWRMARVVGNRTPLCIMNDELGGAKLENLYWNLDCMVFRTLVDWSFELPFLRSSHVIRNLSRRQFFRGAALMEWKNKTNINNVKGQDGIGFNEILLSRICFSSSSPVSMYYEGDIHRGAWAGDRFDFVPRQWVEELGEEEGWTDVSEEVLKEIGEIWESEYGRRSAVEQLGDHVSNMHFWSSNSSTILETSSQGPSGPTV